MRNNLKQLRYFTIEEIVEYCKYNLCGTHCKFCRALKKCILSFELSDEDLSKTFTYRREKNEK